MSSADSSEESPSEASQEQFIAPNFFGAALPGVRGDSSESDEESSESSHESAAEHEQDIGSRLVDYGTTNVKSKDEAGLLPSPADAFSETVGVPEFLDPEATRPLAANPSHTSHMSTLHGSKSTVNQKDGKKLRSAGTDFDIAALAPRLGLQSESAKRGLPEGSVIRAEAKRYRSTDDIPDMKYTEQQVALMGGKVGTSKKGATSMEVTDFLDKGGTAALPRKNSDRRDREKDKRSRGQSSIGNWKTEAEMVLRQQYD